MKTGIERIADERKRQIKEEIWTPEHDDAFVNAELSYAAAAYAIPNDEPMLVRAVHLWPWDHEWWKPTPDDRIRELEKAGALIAAEIDRLQRAE